MKKNYEINQLFKLVDCFKCIIILITIGVAAEKKGESANVCFRRLVNGIFGCHTGDTSQLPNLQSVEFASDRGYMTAALAFEYLLAAGGSFIGTVKRAGCWPFTYLQKLKETDKRTLLVVKGAPTLFIKKTKQSGITVTASAFRNGTESISTTVSSIHQGHHWEGIALDSSQERDYSVDKQSLLKYACSYEISADNNEESTMEKLVMDEVKDGIDIITLCQGSADWHWARKLRLTSSTTHETFKKAFRLYGNRAHWKRVAEFHYGVDWSAHLQGPADSTNDSNENEESAGNDSSDSEDVNGNRNGTEEGEYASN